MNICRFCSPNFKNTPKTPNKKGKNNKKKFKTANTFPAGQELGQRCIYTGYRVCGLFD